MTYSIDEKRVVSAGSPSRQLRRHLLLLILLAPLPRVGLAGTVPGTLPPTPPQMLGAFYPPRPDTGAGNDLASVDGRQRAAGVPLRVVGRVLDLRGRPLADVLVEIWQTNAHGRYHHPDDDSPAPLDPAFRGYGRTSTGADGDYDFRTVMPVAYPGRTPHIHFKLSRRGHSLLVTQMYLPEEASRNARDALFRSTGDTAARQRLVATELPAAGERVLRFDIVLAVE